MTIIVTVVDKFCHKILINLVILLKIKKIVYEFFGMVFAE